MIKKETNDTISQTRKIYFLRLLGRIIVLLVTFYIFLFHKEMFSVAERGNFFKTFSPLHLLWGIWILDMLMQLIPVKAHISIGSQKVFLSFFKPIKEKINYTNLKKHIKETTSTAYKVMIIWLLLCLVIWWLFLSGVIDVATVVLISTLFYVCDLICVLIWCPFRLIMKNKCCTTCRIFNWDHLMMFSPLVFAGSFFAGTLTIFSFVIWLVWEICVFVYPERFWENSNMALRCSECTDKLCTQYCRKLR